ncbi:MAG: hypothetical protein JJT76_12750 [Clostridiaceae bacterium]|nr:hypothetical protein [Clostridiaceae bacterium]
MSQLFNTIHVLFLPIAIIIFVVGFLFSKGYFPPTLYMKNVPVMKDEEERVFRRAMGWVNMVVATIFFGMNYLLFFSPIAISKNLYTIIAILLIAIIRISQKVIVAKFAS